MLMTFVALIMPVLVLLMAAVMDVSHVVRAKVILQNATDRAAYAGAAKQAYVMNEMGAKNREINGIFEKLKSEIVPNSNNGAEDVKQKVKDANQRIAAAYSDMETWNTDASALALQLSRDVARNNYADAHLISHNGSPMLTLADGLESNQRQHLTSDHNNMVGGLIWEPASHDKTENVVQSYYIKDPAYEVHWQVELVAPMPKGILSQFFAAPDLHAVAAAQPYGSSIKECGLNPSCPSYEVSFVPYTD